MATYKFLEGFDHWASVGDGVGKGWTAAPNGGGSITFVAGRFGGQAVNCGGYNSSYTKPLPSNQTTLFLGSAVALDGNFDNGTYNILAVSTGGTIGVKLQQSGQSTLSVVDSSGTTTTLNGFMMPSVKTWTYLEMSVVAGASGSGTVVVRQDGRSLGTIAASTTGSSSVYFDTAIFYTPYSSGTEAYLDDIYISNGVGVDTSFCGPMQVVTQYPTSDVSNTGGWAPNTGTTLYTQIDEAHEDGDATTIASSTNGSGADFEFGSATALGSIIGAQVTITASGQDTSIAGKITSNGTLHVGPYSPLTSTYTAYAPECLDVDPATGVRWTAAGLNSATKGILKGSP